MPETVLRVLRLLAALQSGRCLSAEELADSLDVTTRTVRRDVARLRDLGFGVQTMLGPHGGYRLGPGGSPASSEALDNHETVALLLADPSPALDAVAVDARHSARRKMTRVLPAHLRATTSSLISHTSDVDLGRVVGDTPPRVDADVLTTLARACREGRRVRVTSGAAPGQDSLLEPAHLVRAMGRWYLVSREPAGEWLPRPVDEMVTVRVTRSGRVGTLDAEQARARVTALVVDGVRRVSASVVVHASARQVERWVEPAWGSVTPLPDNRSCLLECGADDYDGMARWLLLIGAEIDVHGPPALAEAFDRVAAQAGRAARRPGSRTRQRQGAPVRS